MFSGANVNHLVAKKTLEPQKYCLFAKDSNRFLGEMESKFDLMHMFQMGWRNSTQPPREALHVFWFHFGLLGSLVIHYHNKGVLP